MADEAEIKQTTPKGVEIPVPKRDDFLRNMEKVAPPSEADQRDSDSTADDAAEK